MPDITTPEIERYIYDLLPPRDAVLRDMEGEGERDLLLQLHAELVKTAVSQSASPETISCAGSSGCAVQPEKLPLPLQYRVALHRVALRPALLGDSDCASNCDRVMMAALGICSLYALAGIPLAAAICVTVTLAEYSNCLGSCDKPLAD
jgi:hypothetical protein